MMLQMVHALSKNISHSLFPVLLNVTQAAKWSAPIVNHLGCITSRELGVRWQKLSSENKFMQENMFAHQQKGSTCYIPELASKLLSSAEFELTPLF